MIWIILLIIYLIINSSFDEEIDYDLDNVDNKETE